MAEIKVKRCGNSLEIIIPCEIAEQQEIKVGDRIELQLVKKKRVSGFGMFKGLALFKRDEKDHEFNQK